MEKDRVHRTSASREEMPGDNFDPKIRSRNNSNAQCEMAWEEEENWDRLTSSISTVKGSASFCSLFIIIIDLSRSSNRKLVQEFQKVSRYRWSNEEEFLIRLRKSNEKHEKIHLMKKIRKIRKPILLLYWAPCVERHRIVQWHVIQI